MPTIAEVRDALEAVRSLSAELLKQMDYFPGQENEEAEVPDTWTRQFVKAAAKAMVLVTEATIV